MKIKKYAKNVHIMTCVIYKSLIYGRGAQPNETELIYV